MAHFCTPSSSCNPVIHSRSKGCPVARGLAQAGWVIPPRLRQLVLDQSGVLSRRQALEHGLDDNDIERLLRRREWARVHQGVYAMHTGPPSWSERAWAAVLFHWPAALAGPSALQAHGLRQQPGRIGEPTPAGSIHVVAAAGRSLSPPPGVLLTKRVRFESRVLLHLSPPRLRLEEALLDVASAAPDEAATVAVLADACQQGRTTAERLRSTLETRGRLPRRRLLAAVLSDVAEGALSVFERRYLCEVERRHGLPTARRQVRVRRRGGVVFRDVEYREYRTVVELDGRLVHSDPRHEWTDLARDVASAVAGDLTVRLGWLHVLEPCRTAGLLAILLRSRGWSGAPRSCGNECVVGQGILRPP